MSKMLQNKSTLNRINKILRTKYSDLTGAEIFLLEVYIKFQLDGMDDGGACNNNQRIDELLFHSHHIVSGILKDDPICDII